jgi:hypothetical protein
VGPFGIEEPAEEAPEGEEEEAPSEEDEEIAFEGIQRIARMLTDDPDVFN